MTSPLPQLRKRAVPRRQFRRQFRRLVTAVTVIGGILGLVLAALAAAPSAQAATPAASAISTLMQSYNSSTGLMGDERHPGIGIGIRFGGARRSLGGVPPGFLGVDASSGGLPLVPSWLGLGDLPSGRLFYLVASAAAGAGVAGARFPALVVGDGMFEV
jgi:hypothetical protein